MAKKTEERKLAEKIAAEKGIKVRSAMRYIQRAKATGNKQKINKPRFAGLSEKVAKKAKFFVKRAKKKAEKPKKIFKAKVLDLNDFISNPIFGANKSGKTTVSVKANFSYDGDDRRINLTLTAEETDAIINAETLDEALEVWQNSTDGAFLKDWDITDFQSISIR